MKNKNIIILICTIILSLAYYGGSNSLNIIDSIQSSNEILTDKNAYSEITTDNHTDNPQEIKIHFLDVGQADSIFIELPNNENMLIDAGNNSDDKYIVEYIMNLNFEKINYIIGTHPHEDHLGGLDTIIKTFDIENIYLPRAQHNSKTYEDVLLATQGKNLKIKTAKAGVNIIDTDNLQIDILAPVNLTYSNLNDYSAVIKIEYIDNSFLFMGDAEDKVEEEITADVSADVIKIGHHGSDSSTSNEFLTKVSPIYAIISVGENDYGHPSDEVLNLLNNMGVKVYRTDKNGNITVTSDGLNIKIDE